VIAVNID